MSSSKSGTLAGLFFLIGTAVLAGLLFPSTGKLVGFQDGDGILTAFISTQKLTWYFWGQDRFLNTLPAAASFIGDIDLNLRFQIFLRAFFGYLAPIGILIFLSRNALFLTVATALANVVMIFGLHQYGVFNVYVQYNPFATSFVLFAAAYLVMDLGFNNRGMWALSLLIAAVAYATNFALLLFTFPFIFFLFVIGSGERRRMKVFGVINLLAVVLAYAAARHFGEHVTTYGINPSLAATRDGLLNIGENINLVIVLVLGIVSASCVFHRKITHKKELLALSFLALMLAVSMPNLAWLQMNGFNIRYFLVCIVVLSSVCAYIITSLFLDAEGRNSSLAATTVAAAFLAMVMVGLGGISTWPGEVVRAQWRDASRAIAAEAYVDKVGVVIGNFWDVWPTLFEIQRLHDAAPDKGVQVYGAAERGHVMAERFLRDTAGHGEQTGLCFSGSVAECVEHLRGSMRIPAEIEISAHEIRRLAIERKDMILIGFNVLRPGMPVAGALHH